MFNTGNNIMLYEARKAKHKPHIVLQILIFIAVFFVCEIATSIIIGVPLGIVIAKNYDFAHIATEGIEKFQAYIYDFMNNLPEWFTVLTLFATALMTFLVIVYCRHIEGRSFASMGLRRRGMLKNYGFGYLIGIAMITATVALAVLLGGAKFSGLNSGASAFYVVLFFLGYLVQGMSEEVCVRGYFMISLTNKVPVAVAVFLSSLVFSAGHLANQGISLLAVINLTLFGTFAACYVLRMDDLWGACAIHSAWNFFQGNVFGISVSGTGLGSSVFGTTFVSGREIISGGSFGIEGGLCTTIVLTIGIALVLFLPQKERPALPTEEQTAEKLPTRHEPLPLYIQK